VQGSDRADRWTMQWAGSDCYLCPTGLAKNADITPIATLTVSTLYLTVDQRFRGNSVLVLADHVTGLDALAEYAYTAYMGDLRLSVVAIRKSLHPDHMNVALLGNTCPHLHWSIVPRYRDDCRWGRPVWEESLLQDMKDRPVTLTDGDRSNVMEQIRGQLGRK
jgi:diadenosine tetraphosphate (Ap4A) HIT family hydrolase